MGDNPYCRCGNHLGMPYHTTSEHKYAVQESEENDHSVMLLSPERVNEIADWCGGKAVVEHDALDHDKTFAALNVPTNRGVQRASEGDYVIKQEDGSFEVMGPNDYRSSHS